MENIFIMKTKKQIIDFWSKEKEDKLKLIQSITKILLQYGSVYWLNRLNNNKTIDGKYQVAKKIDLAREFYK